MMLIFFIEILRSVAKFQKKGVFLSIVVEFCMYKTIKSYEKDNLPSGIILSYFSLTLMDKYYDNTT